MSFNMKLKRVGTDVEAPLTVGGEDSEDTYGGTGVHLSESYSRKDLLTTFSVEKHEILL